MNTQINHPDYYRAGNFECSDYIEAFDLNFNLGNVIKYISRAGRKPGEDRLTAYKKAREYLDREIARVSPEKATDLLVAPEITQ